MTSGRSLRALALGLILVLAGSAAAAPTPRTSLPTHQAEVAHHWRAAAATHAPPVGRATSGREVSEKLSRPTSHPSGPDSGSGGTGERTRVQRINAIVDQADPDLMEVLVTRRDSTGRPRFETVKATDTNHARAVVGRLLGTPGVIGVEMNQRITVAEEPSCLATDPPSNECASPPAADDALPEPTPTAEVNATPSPAHDPGSDAESNTVPGPPPAPSDPLLDQQWALDGQHLAVRELKRITLEDSQQVTVAVIDTGVQADHPDLAGRIGEQVDFITPSGNLADECGHGTHVAGTIAAIQGNDIGVSGMMRAVTIHSVKVLGTNPDLPEPTGACEGTFASVAEGIRWAADRADVLNLSLAASVTKDDLEPSVAMGSAVADAIGKGRVVIAAAGNQPPPCNSNEEPCATFPAAYPGVVGVGAINVYGSVPSFSNRGRWVDLVAPGVAILSTCRNSGYCLKNGTSMAAPHVSAIAAMTLVHCSLSGPEVSERLIEHASHYATGHDDTTGYGLVQPRKALQCS